MVDRKRKEREKGWQEGVGEEGRERKAEERTAKVEKKKERRREVKHTQWKGGQDAVALPWQTSPSSSRGMGTAQNSHTVVTLNCCSVNW